MEVMENIRSAGNMISYVKCILKNEYYSSDMTS